MRCNFYNIDVDQNTTYLFVIDEKYYDRCNIYGKKTL